MTTESGLSKECESVLGLHDAYAKYDEERCRAVVFNINDEAIFKVTTSISTEDLHAMLRYGEHRYKGGIERGKEELSASLRALLGAAGRDDE